MLLPTFSTFKCTTLHPVLAIVSNDSRCIWIFSAFMFGLNVHRAFAIWFLRSYFQFNGINIEWKQSILVLKRNKNSDSENLTSRMKSGIDSSHSQKTEKTTSFPLFYSMFALEFNIKCAINRLPSSKRERDKNEDGETNVLLTSIASRSTPLRHVYSRVEHLILSEMRLFTNS